MRSGWRFALRVWRRRPGITTRTRQTKKGYKVMPRYEKNGVAYETSSKREGTRLLALGYKESKARTKDVREADEKAKKS